METKVIHLTRRSANSKTGPIPVSTTAKASCPKDCPFRGGNGCYAEYGPLAIHWKAVSAGQRGVRWTEFCQDINTLPDGQIWRHNQAGDLLHRRGRIDARALVELTAANRRAAALGFTYTHHRVLGPSPLAGWNRTFIERANRYGFTINLSADSLAHADKLFDLGIGPVAAVLPKGFEGKNTKTPGGKRVVVCPAYTHENVTCEGCKLCARANRRTIVGFPAHGSGAGKVSEIAEAA